MVNPYIKRAYATSEYAPNDVLELRKCLTDPIHFMKGYIKVQHPTRGIVPFDLYEYQIEMVNAVHNHKDCCILASRQTGKTTVIAMYILWFALFQEDKTCIIASKSMEHAVEIMSRIKTAYEELPHWLKAGCKFFNRTSIEFDNGSKIKCEATSEKTGRGSSPAILMVDEIAFISRRIQDAMWASLAPSLSTGGKFILTSTPNGDSDLFATIWRGAMSGINSFFPVQAMWYQHPDRGQEYYNEMRIKLGELACRQEIDCEFLSSDALLINSLKLIQLRSSPPKSENMGVKFWKEDIGSTNKHYLVGADIATGSGADSSVIEIFEFPSLEQVGEYRSNEINIAALYEKIKWVINLLSKADERGRRAQVSWTFERNAVGEAIAALYNVDENPPEFADLLSDSNDKPGMMTTGKNKIISCLQLKSLIEKTKNGMTINSEQLLFELKHLVATGGSYAAKQGATDDAVSATLLIVRLLKLIAEYDDTAFEKMYKYNENDHMSNEEIDEPMPFAIL